MIFLSIFLICLQVVFSQKTSPIITASSIDPMVSIGGSVSISCTVQNLNNYTVVWQKVDKDRVREPISLFFGSVKLIPETRFDLHYDSRTGVHALHISNIKDSDVGFYKCAIPVTSDIQISREIRVQVKVPPIIYENSTSAVTVPLHNATKLECYVSGQPEPNVLWTRENNASLPTGEHEFRGNVLRILNATKEMAGIYYCNANNNVGSSVKKSIKLEVEFPPVVQVKKSRVGQAVSYDAELECRASAVPAPTIVWSKDGVPVQNMPNQHYEVSQIAFDNYYASRLHIISVERSLYGNYTCKAANKMGEERATVDFYETTEEACFPTCGAGLGGYPDFKLIFSTSLMVILIFIRW